MKSELKLHKAKLITDDDGYIFGPNNLGLSILSNLIVEDVVRISMILKNPPSGVWTYDSPYICIKEIKSTSGGVENILGEILDDNRYTEHDNKYPVRTGERIWFDFNNIIEIPLEMQRKKRRQFFKQFLTKEYVNVTGPLYTIEEDKSDESDSNNSHDSYSDYSDE